jgi:hypothetical protein
MRKEILSEDIMSNFSVFKDLTLEQTARDAIRLD